MKKNIIILILFTVLLSGCSSLQKTKKTKPQSFEGKITFDITYLNSSLPPEAIQQLASKTVLYIKKSMMKSDSYSRMMSNQAIKDVKAQTVIRLLTVMGQKYMVKDTFEEIVSSKKQLIFTDNHKIIAGYDCNEVILKDEEHTDTLYYTPQIGTVSYNFDVPDFNKINGIPLSYTMHTPYFSIKMEAKEISKERVSNSIFKIPSDYKEITEEELKKIFIE